MSSTIEKPVCVYLKGPECSSKNRRLLKFISTKLTSECSVNYSANLESFLDALKLQIRTDSGTAVLCGGDGMVHHAIQLLAGTSVAVLPLPGGTANDLSRELGWCPLSNRTVSAQRRSMDCLRVNSRFVATVGGLGHGAEVIRRIEAINGEGLNTRRFSKTLGKWIYAAASAGAAFQGPQQNARYLIDFESASWEGSTSSIFVCNQGTLAGTFTICKSSTNGDGRFELVVPRPVSGAASLLTGLASILFRRPLTRSAACFFSTREARITARPGPHCRFFGDGELLPQPPDNEYRITMEPGILTVIRRI